MAHVARITQATNVASRGSVTQLYYEDINAPQTDISSLQTDTNPFSSLSGPPYERLIAELKATRSKEELDSKLDQTIRIDQLDAGATDCRLLLQPELGELSGSSGEWRILGRLGTSGDPDETVAARCLAVTPSSVDICCELTSPVHCRIFYAPDRDSVDVQNLSGWPLLFEQLLPVDPKPRRRMAETVYIGPNEAALVSPGAWRVSTLPEPVPEPTIRFQVRVFPRQHSVLLVRQPARTGIKRDRSGRKINPIAQQTIHSVFQPLNSIDDSREDQVIQISLPGEKEFTLGRMQKLGQTKAGSVFQARHSEYHEQTVIVVKILRPGDKRTTNWQRAHNWQREFSIHMSLQSKVIVRLFGGDSRIYALFMEHIDAKSLSHEVWCSRNDWKFTGGTCDALRILRDMGTALQDLRRQKVLNNDIKPANILYSPEIGGVMIDFGLATRYGQGPMTGGTPWYVAPEYTVLGQRGPEAEIWALGVVMLYLLKRISQPERGGVSEWRIADVGKGRINRGSESAKRQREWFQIVQTAATPLASGGNRLEEIVADMLVLEPRDRISLDELVRRTTELTIK